MSNYKPSLPYNVPAVLLIPTVKTEKGVPYKEYPSIEAAPPDCEIYISFKTYGGTEQEVNGLYSIRDTANVETWFRPDITGDCRIGLIETGAVYEIISEPENINMQNLYMKFKAERVKGGA